MNIEEALRIRVLKLMECQCDWVVADVESLCGIKLLSRKNISETINGHSYKYVEYSEINRGDTICVGIGFNPAQQSPDIIDRTNQKIINALSKSEYSAYILLNLYPLVTASKADFDESDERSLTFSKKCLPKLLDYIHKYTNAKVLIFWGRTVCVNEKIFKILKDFCRANRLLMTVKAGESIHCHPAYVPIDIVPVSPINLKETYSIR